MSTTPRYGPNQLTFKEVLIERMQFHYRNNYDSYSYYYDMRHGNMDWQYHFDILCAEEWTVAKHGFAIAGIAVIPNVTHVFPDSFLPRKAIEIEIIFDKKLYFID